MVHIVTKVALVAVLAIITQGTTTRADTNHSRTIIHTGLEPVKHKAKRPKSSIVSRVLRRTFFGKLHSTGFATWYGIGDGFQGKNTASYDANGHHIKFNTYEPMCAMHNGAISLHTDVIVENPYSHKWARCTILDHIGNPNAVIDLSYVVAKQIGRLGNGLVNIYLAK